MRVVKQLFPVLLAGLVCLNAHAQEAVPGTPEEAETPPPAALAVEPIAPYDDKLLRLAEVLGSVHYLRNLCGAKEPSKWRDSMSRIIAAEKPGPKRKARLIARFNRGYRAFDGTYSACTTSATTAAQRYTDEGALLASQITGRYGR